MFAFALYENKKLNLVVDHFGEKPLYYIELKEEYILLLRLIYYYRII